MDNLLIKDLALYNANTFVEAFKDKCFNFYDWFCKDSSLKNKAKNLFNKVKKLVLSNGNNAFFNFSGEGTDVFFKNNCPCYGDGRLYDSFSICDGNGDVICWVAPKNPYGYVELSYEGHGFENGTNSLSFNSFNELCNYIMNPKLFDKVPGVHGMNSDVYVFKKA